MPMNKQNPILRMLAPAGPLVLWTAERDLEITYYLTSEAKSAYAV